MNTFSVKAPATPYKSDLTFDEVVNSEGGRIALFVDFFGQIYYEK